MTREEVARWLGVKPEQAERIPAKGVDALADMPYPTTDDAQIATLRLFMQAMGPAPHAGSTVATRYE